MDLAGLIAPKTEIERLIADTLDGSIKDVYDLNQRFARLHNNYYDLEWTWAFQEMLKFFNLKADQITRQDIIDIISSWIDAVVSLDQMVYADAKKEFSLSAKIGFGADGSSFDVDRDFEMVRGLFEGNSFVKAVIEHIEKKTNLGKSTIEKLCAE